jgi:toxin ParE1/3/4
MACEIRWSPRAASHLHHICEFIARDSETYACIFAQRIIKTIENISLFPLSGRIVPEYNDKNLRERIFGHYRIVYRLKEECIEIAAVCHGSKTMERDL